MYHRICLSGALTIPLHHLIDIRYTKNFGKIIYNPRNTLVQIVPRNILKHLTQEGVGTRNKSCRFLTRKILRRWIMQASCKHTIRNSLCIYICKLFCCNVVH